MPATMTRAALLSAAEAARARNPAWIATGGLTGSPDAVETTFTRPVQRGAVWVHELDGLATLVMRDPRDVVEQIQRAANQVLRARGRSTIREDATWGPRTREALLVLAASAFDDSGRVTLPESSPNPTLIEAAILVAFYGGRGQVVLPRRMELPAFTTSQEVARMPAGHADSLVLAEGGRVLSQPAPPAPAPAVPVVVPAAPPVCNPRLVLAALPPGKTAEAWATMDDSARLAAWRSYAAANPGAAIPGCPEGARVDAIVLPTAPAPETPTVAQASAWGGARALVIAGGVVAFGYVVHVVARELRSPSGRGARRVTRRLSVPPRRARG